MFLLHRDGYHVIFVHEENDSLKICFFSNFILAQQFIDSCRAHDERKGKNDESVFYISLKVRYRIALMTYCT